MRRNILGAIVVAGTVLLLTSATSFAQSSSHRGTNPAQVSAPATAPKPAASKPNVTTPDVETPEVDKPEVATPETGQPDTGTTDHQSDTEQGDHQD